MTPIRVLLTDDQALVRRGFRLILDSASDVTVVGEAADGQAAVDAVARLDPDAVLMDIRMPCLDGLAATRRLTQRAARPRVLVLTTYDLDEYVYEALRAGASGFLLKDIPPEELAPAVRVVAGGDALLAPSVTRRLIEEFARRPSNGTTTSVALGTLTDRERDALRMLARGLSNLEIATRLGVSETTVKTHLSKVFTKLGLRDRVQAVVFAYESGFVHTGQA